jgi:hypothetical protein
VRKKKLGSQWRRRRVFEFSFRPRPPTQAALLSLFCALATQKKSLLTATRSRERTIEASEHTHCGLSFLSSGKRGLIFFDVFVKGLVASTPSFPFFFSSSLPFFQHGDFFFGLFF